MEIRNLYTFLQVASMENFTQAGHVLGYSQSNVSAQIQQLEDEIGVKLFDRIGRGVVLTQYGRDLIPSAQQIVSISERMGNFMRPEEEMVGSLNVGIVESLFHTCFEQFILQYSKRFPKIKINLTVDGTAALLELIKKGVLDVVCVVDNPLPKSKWLCAYEKQVQIVAVTASGHPLAGKGGINLADLTKHKVILMENSAPYNVNLRRLMAEEGVEIEPILTLQGSGMAASLVEKSDYVSFLPDYTVRKAVDEGRLAVPDILNYEQTQAVQIILHQNKVVTPQIEGFLAEVRSVFDTVLRS